MKKQKTSKHIHRPYEKKQASIFFIKRKTKNHTHAKTFMDHMIKHLVITSYQKLKKKNKRHARTIIDGMKKI